MAWAYHVNYKIEEFSQERISLEISYVICNGN